MNYDLDHAMWATWQQIEARVLGNEIELRRRLDRRAKVFNRVPRALCLAIRAADRRITAMNAWMSPRWGSDKGMEEDHDLLMTSSLVKQLCCPVHISAPGEPVTDVQQYLGCHYFTARKMERRGVVDVHAIKGLGGRKGKPVPLAYGPRPLDPCARGKAAPTEILEGFWEHIAARMPADMEQLVRRKPIFRLSAGRRKLVDWKWVCPLMQMRGKDHLSPHGRTRLGQPPRHQTARG